MGHAHAVRLHGVSLAVVEVAHIGVVKVRDLLLARHRVRTAEGATTNTSVDEENENGDGERTWLGSGGVGRVGAHAKLSNIV